MKPTIVTIGAATLDVFVASRQFVLIRDRRFVTGEAECLALGSKIDIPDATMSSGGGATNAAATYAHLGFTVRTIARIGQDSFGIAVRHDLQRHDIPARSLRVDQRQRTAFSILLSTFGHGRTVLIHRGASAHFRPADIRPATLRGATMIHLTSLGGGLAVHRRLFDLARQGLVPVAWNPGQQEIALGKRLQPFLRQTAFLFVNKEEAWQVLGRRLAVPTALRQLQKLTGGMVIITDDRRGTMAINPEGHRWHSGIHTAIKPVERTGAGDGFASGFVAGWLRYQSVPQALQIGTANAESVIQKVGAKNGVLHRWPRSGLIRVRRL